MRILLLVFIVIPILEVWLLVEVGALVGVWPTIGLVLLTGLVGVKLLRREGLSTLMRGNNKMNRGELPAQEMVEGLVLAVSGALLLTPGFATDLIGFAGLLPWSRQWGIAKVMAGGHLQAFNFQQGSFQQGAGVDNEAEYQRSAPFQQGSASQQRSASRVQPLNSGSDHTIEGEYWQDDDTPKS